MVLGGLAADVQRRGDLRVGEAGRDEPSTSTSRSLSPDGSAGRRRGAAAARRDPPRRAARRPTRVGHRRAHRAARRSPAPRAATPCRRVSASALAASYGHPMRRNAGRRAEMVAGDPARRTAPPHPSAAASRRAPHARSHTPSSPDRDAVPAPTGELERAPRAARRAGRDRPSSQPASARATATGHSRCRWPIAVAISSASSSSGHTSSSPRRARSQPSVFRATNRARSTAARAGHGIPGVRLGLVPLPQVEAAAGQPRHARSDGWPRSCARCSQATASIERRHGLVVAAHLAAAAADLAEAEGDDARGGRAADRARCPGGCGRRPSNRPSITSAIPVSISARPSSTVSSSSVASAIARSPHTAAVSRSRASMLNDVRRT